MQLTALLRPLCAAMAIGSLVLAGPAASDSVAGDSVSVPSGGKTVTEELLDIMLHSGQIDHTQYDALLSRARQEERDRAEAARNAATAAVASASATPEVSSDKPSWDFGWKNGFKLSRSDGEFELKFGGRLMIDTASIWENPELQNTVGGDGFGTELRRARIFTEGTLWKHLVFKTQLDFANTGDGSVDIKDAYIGLKDLGPIDKILVGHQKEPFSLEELTSSKYITFMERSSANVFAPSRNTGIATDKTFFDKRLLAQLGVFQETNDSAFSFSRMRDWNIATRLAGAPVYEDEGSKVVHLGFGYTHRFANANAPMRYRQRPESHLATRFVDTGAIIPTVDLDQINPEFALVLGPFSLQAEYIGNWASNSGVVPGTAIAAQDTYLWGTYAEASYFLTGEHRNYELGKGRFGRTALGENFDPMNGDCGAWEVAARYSYLDLNDQFARGGNMTDLTVGVNWYLFPNTRLMFNYIHSWVRNRAVGTTPALLDLDGHADIIQARFQIDY